MNSLHTIHLQILQCQIDIAKIQVEAMELKEYDASWLPNIGKVLRGPDGKFGSAKKSITQSVQNVWDSTSETATTLSDGLKKFGTDSKKAVSSELLTATSKAIEFASQKYPDFADKLLSKMVGADAKQVRENLAKIYGSIHPDLAKIIEQDPLAEIKDDLDRPIDPRAILERALKQAKRSLSGKDAAQQIAELLKGDRLTQKQFDRLKADLVAGKFVSRAESAEKAITAQKLFQYAGQKYNTMLDDLEHLDKTHPPAVRVLGKVAAHAIPVATYLAAALGPEVAVGLLLKEGMASILASAAVGQAASVAANKAMDAAKIENPIARIGIDLAVGIGAGVGVSAAAKKIRVNNAAKVPASSAEKVAATADDQVATQAEKVAKADVGAQQKQIAKEVAESAGKSYVMPSEKEIRATSEMIGNGIAGEVFKDPQANVVYKVAKKDLSSTAKAFLEEAKLNSLKEEIEFAATAGDLGVGPKVLASSGNGYAMEYLGGHKTWGEALKTANLEEKQKLFDQTIDQLAVLHKNKIAHGDLHVENVLVSQDGNTLTLPRLKPVGFFNQRHDLLTAGLLQLE